MIEFLKRKESPLWIRTAKKLLALDHIQRIGTIQEKYEEVAFREREWLEQRIQDWNGKGIQGQWVSQLD